MTDDDLDLPARLQARAHAVRATPDLADVERRATDRRRRRTRAAGATLALVAVIGTAGGFALGRASAPEEPAVVATGQALGHAGGTGGGSADDEGPNTGSTDYAHPFPFLGERTTADGIRLRVHATPHGSAGEGDPCRPDRFVRVGVATHDEMGRTAADVIGVVALPLHAAGPGYVGVSGIAGVVEDRWIRVVLVATDAPSVAATFPDGSVDEATAVDGLAVLASYVDRNGVLDAEEVLAQTVTIAAGADPAVELPSPPPCEDGAVTSTSIPAGGEEKPPLPAAGEQPADLEAARAAVTAVWESAYDPARSEEEKAAFQELPEVWLDANRRFQEQQPGYHEIAQTVHGEVDEVVFTAPDRASVRFQLLSDDPRSTVARYQVGEAVLVADGTWRVAASTSCALLALGGVECRMPQ